jgi:hypothetical protein
LVSFKLVNVQLTVGAIRLIHKPQGFHLSRGMAKRCQTRVRKGFGGASKSRQGSGSHSLSDEELVAAHALIREGEAEIINEACKPFVVRVLAP